MTRYVLEIEFDDPSGRMPEDMKRELVNEAKASVNSIAWDYCDSHPLADITVRLAEVKLPVERTREPKPVDIGRQGVLGRDYVDL